MQTTLNPTQSREAQRFALKLVCKFHGELCEQVALALFKWGRQSLHELAALSRLPMDALRSALIVLVQCNLINVYSDPHSGTALYEPDLSRMTQILRRPRFLEYVARTLGSNPTEWGPIAFAVFRAFQHYGRLRLDQIPVAVGPEASGSPHLLREAVRALVRERMIERVPPATLPPPPSTAKVDDRATKRRKALEPEAEVEAAQAARVRAGYQADRFTIPLEDNRLETFTPGGGGGGGGGGGPADAAVKAEEGEERLVTLWRVNNEEFNRLQRNAAAAEAVGAPHGRDHPAAAAIAAAWLSVAAAREAGLPVDAQWSGAATISEITAEAARLAAQNDQDEEESASDAEMDKTVDFDAVDDLIGVMMGDGEADEVQGPAEDRYVMNVELVLNSVRLSHVMCVLGKRHGPLARRCWRLLNSDGPFDQRVIAEKAMGSNTEVRRDLYNLLKDGYVAIQEVPSTVDRAPSRTTYLWRAKTDRAIAVLGMQLYKTAGNLMARIETERAQRAHIGDMIELVEAGDMEESQLDPQKVAKYKYDIHTLEVALVRVEGQLALVVPGG